MLEYIQKFNQLPQEIKRKVSNRETVERIEELEKKYGCNLAMLVMRVAIKNIAFNDLRSFLAIEFKLSDEQAAGLSNDLKNKIFSPIYEYLVSPQNQQEKIEFSNQVLSPEKPKVGSDFYFSPEDEEEIRNISKKIDNYGGSKDGQTGADKIISEVIKDLNINFGSHELLGRFENIIHIYIKGVRNKIDTRLSLKKAVIDGGVNFDDNMVDKIFKLVDLKKSAQESFRVKPAPPKIKLPEESAKTEKKADFSSLGGARDFDYDFSKLKEQEQKNKKSQEKAKNDFSRSLAPPPPAIIKKEKKLLLSEPKIGKKIELDKKLSPSESPTAGVKTSFASQVASRTVFDSGKKRMEDIKAIPKIMSPIDELKYMDLVNFRRTGDNSKNIIEKIKQKIDFLEEEKYSRRIEGIRAWRSSPVNKLYLKIGQESIGQNKSISAIIEERRKKGLDYLSESEIEAIIDLNKFLRY